MAGDWIKMRIDLHDDPAVIGMANAMRTDEFSVVGRLHRLWGWADRQSCDGHAPNVTERWIDRYVSQPGFAAAMQKAGWLELGPDGAVFPNFTRHNGQSAKARALGNNRQQAHRSGSSSRPGRDGGVTREEKEKSTNSPLPPEGDASAFEALLAEYPKHRQNVAAALRRWKDLAPDAALSARIVAAARDQSKSPEWQAEQGKHVPNLSKWLLNEGWKRLMPDVPQRNVESKGVLLPTFTAEQMTINKERARQLLEQTKAAIAANRLPSVKNGHSTGPSANRIEMPHTHRTTVVHLTRQDSRSKRRGQQYARDHPH